MAEQESSGGASASAAADNDMQQEMEQLQTELAEARDKILRAQADLENYRKRSRRELEEERRYANVPLLKDLLPVVDNIDRAMEAAQKANETGTLLEGIKLVKQQLAATLARHYCQEIKAQGLPFDPHLHEALTAQPAAEYPANTVLQVVQPGYQVHDRVIRPSQVIVSKKPEI
jgi:molecular chaperone GrpE